MKMDRLSALAAALAFAAAPMLAQAQGDDPAAMLDKAHAQFAQAVSGQDFERLSAMFTEDAVYQPASGGLLQGRDEIKSWYEQAKFGGMTIEATHSERLGEDMVLDLGSYSATVGDGQEIKGEYVALGEIDGDQVLIRSLSAFPERDMQMPAAN